MKKIIFFITVMFLSFSLTAEDKINDLVIIVNPTIGPGNETSEDDMIVVFFDSQGRKVTVSYTYDPVTNTITITTPGNYFVVITDKKTGKTRTIHIGTFANS